jgi:hypothetical protein
MVDTPTSTPGAVALGLAEVVGTAQPANEPLSLPHEDHPCLLYLYGFFHFDSTDEKTGWQGYKFGILGVPFFLEGDRGRVYVDPTDAEIDFAPHQDLSSGDPPSSSVFWEVEEGPPPKVKDFVDKHDDLFEYRVDPMRQLETADDLGAIASWHREAAESIEEKEAGKRAFYTARIEPGEELYLLGQAQRPDGKELPDDVSAAFRTTDAQTDSSRSTPTGNGIPADPESTLLISTRSEKELVLNKKSIAKKDFIGSVLIFLFGLGLLFWAYMSI